MLVFTFCHYLCLSFTHSMDKYGEISQCDGRKEQLAEEGAAPRLEDPHTLIIAGDPDGTVCPADLLN